MFAAYDLAQASLKNFVDQMHTEWLPTVEAGIAKELQSNLMVADKASGAWRGGALLYVHVCLAVIVACWGGLVKSIWCWCLGNNSTDYPYSLDSSTLSWIPEEYQARSMAGPTTGVPFGGAWGEVVFIITIPVDVKLIL